MTYQLHLLRYGLPAEKVELACADDDCATVAARARCVGRDGELWQGDRLVATIVPGPKRKPDMLPGCPYA